MQNSGSGLASGLLWLGELGYLLLATRPHTDGSDSPSVRQDVEEDR